MEDEQEKNPNSKVIKTYSRENPYIYTIDVNAEEMSRRTEDCEDNKGNLGASFSNSASFREQVISTNNAIDNLGISITSGASFLEENSMNDTDDNLGVSLADLSSRSASASSPSHVNAPSFQLFDSDVIGDPYNFDSFLEGETPSLCVPLFSSTPKKAPRPEAEISSCFSDKEVEISCASSNLTTCTLESDVPNSSVQVDIDELTTPSILT